MADFLIAVSEPVSRPQTIHEYQITALSLNAAIANGISVEKIIQLLVKLSKNVIHEDFLSFIREKGRTTGKLRLVLRGGRHFLESEDEALLRDVSSEATVAECLVDSTSTEAGVGQEEARIWTANFWSWVYSWMLGLDHFLPTRCSVLNPPKVKTFGRGAESNRV